MTLTAISTMTPSQALAALLESIEPVERECVALSQATGRVLAQTLLADRPSPAIDVSAMDGFALRLSDLHMTAIPIAGEVAAGQPPLALPPAACLRIATGAPVPIEADLVIAREHVDEAAQTISVHADRVAHAKSGLHIRRQGENAQEGATILQPGAAIHAPATAALASFGVMSPSVYRRVRITAVITGDEVTDGEGPIADWSIRDSNGSALMALFAACAWIEFAEVRRVQDSKLLLKEVLESAIRTSDFVLVTGGVAVGHKDFVAEVLTEIGARTLFHGIAQKPGRPMLGAQHGGVPVLCLPGNPVSVLVTARKYAMAVARKLAGLSQAEPAAETVRLIDPLAKPHDLTQFLPVRRIAPGMVRALSMRGSGDCVGIAPSNGFIEIPPRSIGDGPWNYFDWN